MNKITLNQLQLLVRVVETGGFSAASAELGCTQSRISHGIAQLERYVGTRLLDRSRSGCKPTSAGQRILTQAQQVLRLVEEIPDSADAAPSASSLRGTVRIACIRSAAVHLIPQVIAALASRHPHLHIEVDDGCQDYGAVVSEVDNGSADLGITRGPVHPQLLSCPYVSDAYVVIAPASIPLQSPVNWEELSHLPFIHLQQPGAKWIVKQCQAIGCTQSPSRELVNECGVMAMVARGLGYSVLPRLTAFPQTPGTQMLELPTPITRHLIIVAKPETAREDRVAAVMHALLDKSVVTETDAWRAGTFTFDC
jgi:DNA-binding transcriptional LysR family regulator